MELITNAAVPNRWSNTRIPPDKTEMTSTQILKVRIKSASAKLRRGGPHDDKKDLKDEELRKRVWTGVVPVWQVMGSPVSGEDNRVGEVPEYVTEFVKSENERAEREAMEAMREPES